MLGSFAINFFSQDVYVKSFNINQLNSSHLKVAAVFFVFNKSAVSKTANEVNMFIVCVAACPTGIAHTYMAAEALEVLGKEHNWEVKVETQGSTGIDNEITLEDIGRADGAIIAAEIAIDGMERFENLKTLECSVADPIKQPAAVYETMIHIINNK
jgi:fructose-specific PTS system IIB-like component